MGNYFFIISIKEQKMRTVYGIAAMLAASQTANALEWSDIKDYVSYINFAELAH